MKNKNYKINLIKKIPIISSVLLILISCVAPIPSGYAFNFPFIPILCIIVWTVLLKGFFSIIDVFLIGLISDLLIGSHLGSYALIFIMVSIFANYIFKKFTISNFFLNFTVATFTILIFYIFQLLFIIIYLKLIPDLRFMFFNLLLTISLYPTIYVIIFSLYKTLKINTIKYENI